MAHTVWHPRFQHGAALQTFRGLPFLNFRGVYRDVDVDVAVSLRS